jgi:hypothetical protein
MGRAGDTEGRMVTGELAFMAARLFTLESRRQVNRLSERLDEALGTIEEMRTLISEHEESIGSLSDRVRILEGRDRGRRLRGRRSSRSSGSSYPPSWGSAEADGSVGDSPFGTPQLRAGMVGNGVDDPYRLVLVEPVEDVMPPPREGDIPPTEGDVAEPNPGIQEGLQARLDRRFDHWVRHGGDPEGTSEERETYWSRVFESRPSVPVPAYPEPPSYRSASPPS